MEASYKAPIAALLIVTLLALRFFGLFELPGILILSFFLLMSWREVFVNTTFRNIIMLMIAFCFLNCMTMQYFRDQSFLQTVPQLSHYLMLFSYFYFVRERISLESLERLLFTLTAIFVFCYMLQYVAYPKVIFSGGDAEFGDDVRIRLYGQNICSLGYFYCLNKVLTDTSKTVKGFSVLAVLALFIMILWGFRTITVALIAISILMYCRIKGVGKFVTLLPFFLVVLVLIVQIPIVSEKIDFMMERFNNGGNMNNKEYIRNILIEYFLNEHFQSDWEMFLGSGLPAGHSQYAALIESLGARGMHWNDMGLWGLSWMLGIPAVATMILYGVKAVLVKVPTEYKYASYWFLFLLLIGFTTAEYIRIGNYIAQAIALAIVHKASLLTFTNNEKT